MYNPTYEEPESDDYLEYIDECDDRYDDLMMDMKEHLINVVWDKLQVRQPRFKAYLESCRTYLRSINVQDCDTFTPAELIGWGDGDFEGEHKYFILMRLQCVRDCVEVSEYFEEHGLTFERFY